MQRYAFEAYPQWAAEHPSEACPKSIGDLDGEIGAKGHVDPWKHDYVMLCGATLPKGVKGVGVLSVGPDGKQGTADDITSWQ